MQASIKVPLRSFLLSYFLSLILVGGALFLQAGTFDLPYKIFMTQSAIFFLAYLCGTIPYGVWMAKIFAKTDVRTIGSGNIGTSNVFRTGSKLAGILTLLLDVAKGFIPIFLICFFLESNFLPLADRCCCLSDLLLYPYPFNNHADSALHWTLFYLAPILGHMFPCWLNFKGGKGIATGLGVLLAVSWGAALVAVGIWILSALLFRRSSVSSLLAFLSLPILMLDEISHGFWTYPLVALVFWAHRDNIKRLLAGKEPKIGSKPKT